MLATDTSTLTRTQWHIFYIDNENRIRQRSNSNTSNVWVDGNINQLNLTANNADQVGMQACWYGSDYGDSDYVHTPLPSNGDASNASVTAFQEVGMHIWYASDHQTFQQLGWRHGDVNWTFQGSWVNKNGHAGVGCYSWGPGTVTYVMMVNLDNAVEIWWKDTNNSLTSTTGHPINAWTNCKLSPLPLRSYVEDYLTARRSIRNNPQCAPFNFPRVHELFLYPRRFHQSRKGLQHLLERRENFHCVSGHVYCGCRWQSGSARNTS